MDYDKLESHWLSMLKGKTLFSIRTEKRTSPVPTVRMIFTDNTEFTVGVLEGCYFEGAMINTLRKAKPVVDVVVTGYEGDIIVEVRAATFPLVVFIGFATIKGMFPFELQSQVGSNA